MNAWASLATVLASSVAVAATAVACGGPTFSSSRSAASTGDSGGPACTVGDSGGCANGLECDPTLGCVECLSASDCRGAKPFCVRGSCQSVACTSDADCVAPTPRCNVDLHTCVECTADSQCPSGKCDNFVCQ